MKIEIEKYLLLYALFLVLSGAVGYVTSPVHAVTAIAGGIAGSGLVLFLRALYKKKILWATSAVNAVVGVFTLTFAWRGATIWAQVFEGSKERTILAALLTVMFVVSLGMVALLIRKHR